KMKKSLSARTVNKYVEYIRQVVASLKDGKTGEPIHPRKWDSAVMDLPVVNPKRQRRPALRLDAINTLVSNSEGDEQALYILRIFTIFHPGVFIIIHPPPDLTFQFSTNFPPS